ncbi:Glycosyl transferase family 2 [Pedobacter suwonensis]|uniref:Glycosyl transferase family 2 n=1 Tax=Pedobacter suwonensis TaxID=332999 RepID=A0A1I0SS51_9SPHI|nr:glycosyltransferase family 2 protein [Pedobacter suwonensis]SFA42233.1 Glycosyl transferase family 2 [Pedobacter suwonensis]
MSKDNIVILMATYNSQQFLRPQLQSIVEQSFRDWKLYIRDDGSQDNTLEIIQDFVNKDERITLINDRQSNMGAARSFMLLLENIEADYFFFCDHDDFWLPEKVERSMLEMKKLERQHQQVPIIVHSDLYVVDHELNVVNQSFWKSSGIKPKFLAEKNIIQVFNCVTGCTMVFNKAARNCSLPYHSMAPMHDWWITIKVLQNKGIVFGIDDPLIYYRQHLSNVVGARNVNLQYFINKVLGLKTTLENQNKQIQFLKAIKGIGPFSYYYYKILYTLIRKM